MLLLDDDRARYKGEVREATSMTLHALIQAQPETEMALLNKGYSDGIPYYFTSKIKHFSIGVMAAH